jgi:protein-S-isoprenylcysteine O-methyltransferase Ste14
MKKTNQSVPIFLFFLFANLPLYILLPKFHFIVVPYNLFGVVVVLAGLVLNLSADRVLRSILSSQEEAQAPKKIAISGIYRYFRHPMYSGMVIILIGVVLFFNSIFLFLLPLVFFAYLYFIIIPYEERMLIELFPNEYPLYQKKTCFLSTIRTFLRCQKKSK